MKKNQTFLRSQLVFNTFRKVCFKLGFFFKEKRLKSTINLLILALVSYLSIPVVINLISEKQAMNTSFEPFRIVNSYGAFGRLNLKNSISLSKIYLILNF